MEDRKEYLFKEVGLIQDIIKRMASNSFMIKGWTLTLVVATFLIKVQSHQAFIAFIPLLVFWYLDAYFLRQERLYRKLYNWVIENRLNTDEKLLDMNAYRFQEQEQSSIRIMFSSTLGWFYGMMAFLTLVFWQFDIAMKK
ncbi:MAG: hypothetical protein GY801_51570 [bacterium]|nr:hypothetical protein [bacterium]